MAPDDRLRDESVRVSPDEEDEIPRPAEPGDDAENGDDDEDTAEAQDYSQVANFAAGGKKSGSLSSLSSATITTTRKNISAQSVRKGEKDFERDGTRTQKNSLEQSRTVMEGVLSYTRVQDDSVSRGWYFPDAWDDEPEDEQTSGTRRLANTRHRVVLVEVPRGVMFSAVGAVPGKKWIKGLKKEDQPLPRPGYDRVWLLPEEALFMVERGSMELWFPRQSIEATLEWADGKAKKVKKGESSKEDGRQGGSLDSHEEDTDDEDQWGIPLSLQAAYALLIGSTDAGDNDCVYLRGRIPLPHYQVYTHLLRSGFQVQRAVADLPFEVEEAPPQPHSLWQWLFSLLSPSLSSQSSSPAHAHPFGPLVQPGLYRSYGPIYSQLHILPRYHPTPTSQLIARPQPASSSTSPTLSPPIPDSPFRIIFHVWKAGHFGSKSRPGPPDFYMAVADAHTTDVPTLDQLSELLCAVPFPAKRSYNGPPRRKQTGNATGPKEAKAKGAKSNDAKGAKGTKPEEFATALISPSQPTNFPPKNFSFGGFPPIYRRLKLAHRSVLVAVVDHGLVNYMRFGEGAFGEEPLWPRFDGLVASGGRFGGGGKGGKGGGGGGGGGGSGKGKGNGNNKGGKNNGKESRSSKEGKEGKETTDGNGSRSANARRASKA